MCPAIVSGIVTGVALVSYWSIFPPYLLVTVPVVFVRVYSDQFHSRVSKLANVRPTSTL